MPSLRRLSLAAGTVMKNHKWVTEWELAPK